MNKLGALVAFIEWFDTSICIVYTDVLKTMFWPFASTIQGFTLSLALLSISCIGKPIGSYLIGKYSDKNRINAAFLSFSLMILCSLISILIPSYQTLGIFSLLLFFFVKFIQGIAMGGNYGTGVYFIEESTQKYFISSLTSEAIFSGFILANLYYLNVIDLFPNHLQYTCKFASFISFLLAIPVFYMFHQIQTKETKTLKKNSNIDLTPNIKTLIKAFIIIIIDCYKFLKKNKDKLPSCKPNIIIPKIGITDYLNDFIKTSILVLLDIIPFQYFHVFFPNYKLLIEGQAISSVHFGNILTLITILIFTPIIGKAADKYGPICFLQLSSLMMTLPIVKYLYIPIFQNIYFAPIYFGVMMSLCYGTLYCYLPLKLPKNVRAKITGLSLNISTSIVLISMPIFSVSIKKYIEIIFFLIGCLCFLILYNDDPLSNDEYEINEL